MCVGTVHCILWVTTQVWTVELVRLRCTDDREHILHARRQYFKSYRFDFVRIRPGAGEAPGVVWIARLMALFQVHVPAQEAAVLEPGWIALALVQWLDEDVACAPGLRTFKLLRQVDVVSMDMIECGVRLLECPVSAAHGVPRYVALPYGKSGGVSGMA